ncbi:MAG: alpha/beta fold hydrolase [Planctomycetota bacterium]|nr:alpha/beta fold hydrolase [Planctomycetota bacterium]
MKRRLFFVYLALLVASNLYRHFSYEGPRPGPGELTATLQVYDQGVRGSDPVRLVYRLHTPESGSTLEDLLDTDEFTTIVLLHGSPGSIQDFGTFAEQLPSHFQVLVPDMPGFGASWAHLPDYSPAAHADYLAQLLEKQAIHEVHLVGFSLGSAVALEYAHRYPGRVKSLTFAGGVGVQELELFGSYALNHAVHAVQLAGISALEWLIPHFGKLDQWPLNRAYARNFYDSDQRPYRAWLQELEQPMLLMHGTEDFLVPVEAAREHHRLVPQSELEEYDDSHFLLWTRPEQIAKRVGEFVDGVVAEEAVTRDSADALRVASAAEDFDPSVVPPFTGPALWFALLLLVLATLISEDLTCIATGLLVAQGRLGLLAGSAACFAGILLGDVLLFLAGRALGRRALTQIPLRWMLTPNAVDRASAWFRRRGAWVIFASRFMPGLRLPTYFAAGVLKTKLSWFVLYFTIAGLIWTPTLVWISSRLGLGAEVLLNRSQEHATWILLALLMAAFLMVKLIVPMFSFRGRRGLVGAARRFRHWEYWSRGRLYAPVLPSILAAAWKHRSLRLVTAVNPAMEGGGLVGESKSKAFLAMQGSSIPVFLPLDAKQPPSAKSQALMAWMEKNALQFPIILKPDCAERGYGVRKIQTLEEAAPWWEEFPRAALAQAYVEGLEFGISCKRMPGENEIRIVALGMKVPPTVTGDGEQNLEQLVLWHSRHVAQAEVILGANAQRLYDIPAKGEVVELSPLGTHSRGAQFLEREDLHTLDLERAIQEICRRIPGFHLGRFDLRVPALEDLQAGTNLSILELNGLTGEPTSLYDPKYSVKQARHALRNHWRDAYTMAAHNVSQGAQIASYRELWKLWRQSR